MTTIPPSPRTGYTPEQWERIYLASRQRSASGYTLPKLPEKRDGWTPEFDQFAKDFAYVLKQKVKDDFNLSLKETGDSKLKLSLLHTAIRQENVHLVTVFHRVLLDAENPMLISDAVYAFMTWHSHELFESVHLDAYTRLTHAVAKQFPYHSMNDEEVYQPTYELACVCFENYSEQRLQAVISILNRGITGTEEVLSALDACSEVGTPLVDGAL